MKYRPYPKYKPSGIVWLGDVPEHWETLPLTKYLSEKSDYRGRTPEKVADGVFLVTARNVRMGMIDYDCSQEYVANEDYEQIMRRGLPRIGDILFTTEAPLGNVAQVDREDIALAQRIIRFRMRLDRFDHKFTLYAMMSHPFQHQLFSLSTGSTAEGLKASKLPLLRLPAPPHEEQVQISQFLDFWAVQLANLVDRKLSLIEKLGEKRQALIARTVTRGLPPEAARAAGFNPCPNFKRSGVEWLGEIPAHWTTPSLYTRYRVELGKMLDDSRITGHHLAPYLRNIDVQWDAINTSDLPEMDICPHEFDRFTVRPGDLLVCEGGEVGRAAIIGPEVHVIGFQKALHRLRPIGAEYPRFMFYTLMWAAKMGVFLAEGNPNTIPHLTGEKLRRYRFPCPPGPEQRAIADYLHRETTKIDRLVDKIEAATERLEEYRSALITAAVTGKIDVRAKSVPKKGTDFVDNAAGNHIDSCMSSRERR